MTTSNIGRSLVLITTLVFAASAAGCAGDDPEPEETTATTPAPSEPAEPPAGETRAAVTDLFHAYFDVVIEAEAKLITDPAHFAEVMTPSAAQVEIAFIENLSQNSLLRSGEPVIADEVTVNVEDGAGLAQACVDPANWLVVSSVGDAVEQPFPPGPHPFVVRVERDDDGRWLVSETLYDQEATISC